MEQAPASTESTLLEARPDTDREDVEGLDVTASLLSVICANTGMGFSAIARVTETRWTAMAVHDAVGFGLKAGEDLALDTTLCKESRAARTAIFFDHASRDPVYANHHTPRLYKLESYISVPIVLEDGEYFGNLRALDAAPRRVSQPHVLDMFRLFAKLIAVQLGAARKLRAAASLAAAEQRARLQREQFIGILAHDLRNPLAAIQAGVDALQRRPDDSNLVLGISERMGRSARRMSGLINDVVDVTRGRLGDGVQLHAETIDSLGACLQQVVQELRDAHPTRHIRTHLDIPRPVRGDRTRLQQLLSNLLGNAVAYGARDRPVEVRACIEGDAVSISVRNWGDLIAPDQVPALFDAFKRGAQADSAGMGLGLYICAEIARAHDGSIDVESTEHRGTVFTARLCILDDSVQAVATNRSAAGIEATGSAHRYT